MSIEIKLDNGKYTYILNDKEHKALRHGKEWRDLTGDNLILNMGFEIEALRTQLAKANERIKELEALAEERAEFIINASNMASANEVYKRCKFPLKVAINKFAIENQVKGIYLATNNVADNNDLSYLPAEVSLELCEQFAEQLRKEQDK